MPKSPASTRSAGDVRLTLDGNPFFSLAITLRTGTVSASGFSRKEFVSVETGEERDGKKVVEDHEVGRQPYDKFTGEKVEQADVVRKVETEYGFVHVTDGEIENLLDLAPNTIVVKAFQPQHLFHQGHYVPKSIQYIEATKVKVGTKKKEDPAAIALLGLLLKAMREENVIAVCEITTRGIPKPAILLPNGTLWLVYHTEEIREQNELPDVELPEANVAQGRELVKTLFSDTPLDLVDHRSALINAFAAEKAEAGDFSKPDEETITTQPVVSTDLTALLAASLGGTKAETA